MPRLPLFVYANHFANELQTKLDGQNGMNALELENR